MTAQEQIRTARKWHRLALGQARLARIFGNRAQAARELAQAARERQGIAYLKAQTR